MNDGSLLFLNSICKYSSWNCTSHPCQQEGKTPSNPTYDQKFHRNNVAEYSLPSIVRSVKRFRAFFSFALLSPFLNKITLDCKFINL